jgi:hypothetical protein
MAPILGPPKWALAPLIVKPFPTTPLKAHSVAATISDFML